MAGLEFMTAFRLKKFEIRILGCEVHLSPSSMASLDDKLCPCFELHHAELQQVLDGFHFLDSCEVSGFYLFIFCLYQVYLFRSLWVSRLYGTCF